MFCNQCWQESQSNDQRQINCPGECSQKFCFSKYISPHHDEAGLAWPSVIAPAAVHVVATGKDAVAFEGAEKLVAELEAKGLEVIYDDRKKVSPGVKFKDAELIGVPLVAVVGRDYVNDGTIELRDRNGENKVAVPAAEAADALAERFAALS